MQHQFNLGSAIQPPPFIPKQDPDAPMLASVEGVATSLSADEFIFQPRGSTDSQVMTLQVLQLLGECQPFRSMDEHIAHALRSVPGLRTAEVARQALQQLAGVGLLQDDAAWLAHQRQPAVTSAPATPFAGLCIRACDRPETVTRLLTSLVAYESRHGVRRPVWMLDDSRDAAAATSNRRQLEAYARQTGAPTTWVGVEAGVKVAAGLRAGLPHLGDTAEALLTQSAGSAGGRTWNLMLLLTAGQQVVMLDEDLVFPLRRHPNAMPGLDLSADDQSTADFYPDLDAVLRAGSDLADDPIEHHLRLLGASFGGVIEAGSAVNRQDLRGRLLVDLAHLTPRVRVKSTQIGTRGASRSDGSEFLFELDAASREEFWRDRASYLENLEARALWAGHRRARVARQSYYTPFALDNTDLTPCTTVGGRNEDAVFGTLLRFCYPDGVSLHLPESIGHVQETARKRWTDAKVARAPGFNRFLFEQLQNADPAVRADDAATRMHFAAAILDNVAAVRDAALAAHLHEYRNYYHATTIERLQRQLTGNPGAPVYWQADLRSLIERHGRAIIAKTAPRLDGWPEHLDAAGCAQRLRRELRTVASGLEAWPEMWAWARDHHDELQRLL